MKNGDDAGCQQKKGFHDQFYLALDTHLVILR